MLYFFDLDGTLVDSLEDLARAMEYSLKKLNLPGHSLQEYQYFIGNGVKKLVLRALGKENESQYEKARALFDEYYSQHCLEYTKPYEGIKELLIELHQNGHIVGVITNKPDEFAKKICKACFHKSVDFVYGQQEKVPLKPNPSIVVKMMNHYHAQKKQCLFIGDSDVDILMGKNAGIKTIGVTWGNRDKEELVKAGASYIVSDAKQLALLLNKVKK